MSLVFKCILTQKHGDFMKIFTNKKFLVALMLGSALVSPALAAEQVTIVGPTGIALPVTSTGIPVTFTGGIAVSGTYNSTLPTLTNGQTASFQFDSSGRLIISPQASSPATAGASLPTVAAGAASLYEDLSGVLRTSSYYVQGTVAAGTAATQSALVGGVYNTSLPTMTNGQQVALQVDASGKLLVDTGSTGGSSATASATLPTLTAGSATTYVNLSGQTYVTENSLGTVAPGTAATQSALAGGVYSSSAPTLTAGQQIALQVDSAGKLLVDTGATNASVATASSTLPTLTAGSSTLYTNLSGQLYTYENLAQVGGVALALGQTTQAASLPVVLDSTVETALGTSGTKAITIQGAATGVAVPISAAALPLPTGASTAANQTTEITNQGTIITDLGTLNTDLTTITATSALQTTGNTSLASIVTNTTGVSTAANQVLQTTALGTIATNQNVTPAGTSASSAQAVQGVTGGVAITVTASSHVRTPAYAVVTTSGTIAAGAQSVTISNTGTTAATVLGATLAPGATITFSANGTDTIGAITYTASSTATLAIVTLT